MRRCVPALAIGALVAAVPADAAVRTLVTRLTPASGGIAAIEVSVLNDGETPTAFAPPATVPATLAWDGGSAAVVLTRDAATPAAVTVAAGGFARLGYALRLPAGVVGRAALTVGQWDRQGLAFAVAPADTQVAAAAPPAPISPAPASSALASPAPASPDVTYTARYRSADGDRGNAFLPNLTAYQPVYAVYGPGTDTDARLQISFKYQLLGDARDGQLRWSDGIHFAFTQRLYWNLGAESSPFRNVDYLPELFYLLPPQSVSSRIAIGGQAGFRHESNGRSGIDSRSFNTLYVQPMVTMPVGSLKLVLGPRAWVYVGSREDNPDIRRYRGNAGLLAEIGRDDGWRLTTESRLNPSSGKGSVDALLSYPLDRIVSRRLKLYAFVQGFAGYGENLLDYDRRTTRLRAGIGLVR